MEKTVTLNDRTFKVMIPAEKIDRAVAAVAQRINADYGDKERPLFVGVLNGAFMFAADLLRQISVPAEISFIKVASYDGTKSTGRIAETIGLDKDIEGRTVVIVEDIIDSGLTMKYLLERLNAKHPEKIYVTALFSKPCNMKADIQIDYCAFRIPDKFIIGYGLDYDGYGRNYPDVYAIE